MNHRFPNIRINWRRLGAAGLILVRAEEYRDAAQQPNSKLTSVGSEAAVRALNQRVIPDMPTENEAMKARVRGCDLIDENGFSSIAYFLGPDPFVDERHRATKALDRLSGVENEWNTNFTPQVTIATIATIETLGLRDDILEAFYDLAPSSLRLFPVRAAEISWCLG